MLSSFQSCAHFVIENSGFRALKADSLLLVWHWLQSEKPERATEKERIDDRERGGEREGGRGRERWKVVSEAGRRHPFSYRANNMIN